MFQGPSIKKPLVLGKVDNGLYKFYSTPTLTPLTECAIPLNSVSSVSSFNVVDSFTHVSSFLAYFESVSCLLSRVLHLVSLVVLKCK